MAIISVKQVTVGGLPSYFGGYGYRSCISETTLEKVAPAGYHWRSL